MPGVLVQLESVSAFAAVRRALAPLQMVRVVVLHVRAEAHLVLGHLEAEAAAEGAAVLAVQVGEVALEIVTARERLLADGAHQPLARVHHHAERVAEHACNSTERGALINLGAYIYRVTGATFHAAEHARLRQTRKLDRHQLLVGPIPHPRQPSLEIPQVANKGMSPKVMQSSSEAPTCV